MRNKITFFVVFGLLDNCLLTNFINGEHIFPDTQALSWKHNGFGSPFDSFAMILPVELLFRNLLAQGNIGPTTPARTTPAALAPNTTTQDPACPPKYSLFEESCGRFCYRYESSVCQNWYDALQTCKKEGGFLLVPSECHYQFFRVLARQNKERCSGNVWMGIVGAAEGSRYITTGGGILPKTFPYWGPGQPLSAGIGICVEMTKTFDYLIRASHCDSTSTFICKRNIKPEFAGTF